MLLTLTVCSLDQQAGMEAECAAAVDGHYNKALSLAAQYQTPQLLAIWFTDMQPTTYVAGSNTYLLMTENLPYILH